MRSRAGSFAWPLLTRTERVGDLSFELEGLESFEAGSAHLYGSLRRAGRGEVPLSPMFGVVWGAARSLAAHLLSRDLCGARVLELGCGLALPSLVAARCGAAEVLATDRHPDAGPLLARNLRRNGLEGAVGYAALDWEAPGSQVPERAFDLVLASDVLYAIELPELVCAAFARFLAPGGVGLLTDPGRTWLPEVEAAARRHGLTPEVDVADDGAGGEAFLVRLEATR